MDKTTLLNKGIHILNYDRFMWIQTKYNYDKHVERLENQKDINEEEEWADKTMFITLFFMKWEALIPYIMLEFLNTFVIKGTNIYFGYQDKMYVISKQLIINVFRACVEGYVEDQKGQIGKTVALHTLQSCKITPTNFARDQWSLGLPYLVRYHVIIFMIYQREKAIHFSNKNAITLMRVEKGTL